MAPASEKRYRSVSEMPAAINNIGCIELIKTMEQDDPEDYWVWMNYAYTYISVQGEIEDRNARDYTLAYDSYNKAEEYYKTYVRNTGVSYANMDSLRNAVDQLIGWGWIKVSGLGGKAMNIEITTGFLMFRGGLAGAALSFIGALIYFAASSSKAKKLLRKIKEEEL